ncbi:MAG: TolC family protein [Candidatus Acidiferrum sp.]
MQRFIRGVCLMLVLAAGSGSVAQAQHALTWDEVKARFESDNPTLLADKLNIDESKAQEITAFLRPNPNVGLSTDGIQVAPYKEHWMPLTGTQLVPGINYLHERQQKRELRLESAKKGTLIAESSHADLDRTLLFNLRSAFVSTLQAKAVLQLAKDNLAYYDHVLDISRDRFHAGDIAQIDLDRLELQRVQYESDVQTAEVNLRTAKIQLLTLLEAVDKAQTDHKLAVANGSTDPTFGTWYSYNPAFNNVWGRYTLGANVSIPLRIFDRNQGEKLRTQSDIGRNEKLLEATRALVFSDVDSAYAIMNSNVILLQPYKTKYLQQAVRVRDTITFSYQQGGASLLDFLNAQSDYRTVELSYVNLIGAYLTAAAQLNLAVGREAIP